MLALGLIIFFRFGNLYEIGFTGRTIDTGRSFNIACFRVLSEDIAIPPTTFFVRITSELRSARNFCWRSMTADLRLLGFSGLRGLIELLAGFIACDSGTDCGRLPALFFLPASLLGKRSVVGS